ncbi:PE family protein, partial [Mycobacterium intermedium]
MSFLVIVPDLTASAAGDVASIGSTISAANAAAAAATTQLLPAAADEVSAAIAALFGSQANEYQRISAQATAFHERFAQALAGASGSYAAAEADAFQVLQQSVLGVVNAPTQLLLGRPLIGDGVNGAPGT